MGWEWASEGISDYRGSLSVSGPKLTLLQGLFCLVKFKRFCSIFYITTASFMNNVITSIIRKTKKLNVIFPVMCPQNIKAIGLFRAISHTSPSERIWVSYWFPKLVLYKHCLSKLVDNRLSKLNCSHLSWKQHQCVLVG